MAHKVQIYSKKAGKYARYRWEYAPAAIDVLCQQAQLSNHSQVADLGAGTGILTRALAGRVERIFAVEPDPEMLREAEDGLLGATNCVLVAASAEATTLVDHSVDAVVVAQKITRRALHQFAGLWCVGFFDQPPRFPALTRLLLRLRSFRKTDLPLYFRAKLEEFPGRADLGLFYA